VTKAVPTLSQEINLQESGSDAVGLSTSNLISQEEDFERKRKQEL